MPDLASLFFPQQPLTLAIPLEPGAHATVTFPRPMTEERWEQFMHVLEVMKPGIVREDASKENTDG
jgi:hypothetical protein